MILSMTGFGRGEAGTDSRKISVELRSINSRYLELSLRMPPALQRYELEVRETIRKRVGRGKLSLQVAESNSEGAAMPIELNVAAVSGLADQLRNVSEKAGLDAPTLRDVLYFHDWLLAEKDEKSAEETKSLLLKALENGIVSMETMRADEGKALAADLEANLTIIATTLEEIEGQAKGNTEVQRKKLEQRLTDAGLAPALIDPMRLTNEVAMLVDRQDISEEIVRLRSHIELFRQTIKAPGAAGKRLNFLTQEMHREANTIASKSGLIEIVHHSVKLREVIEILREQVQNVE